jgi:hypothetical protein
MSANVAQAAALSCNINPLMGPAGVRSGVGNLVFGLTISCPAGSTTQVVVDTTLYKLDPQDNTWTKIDPGGSTAALSNEGEYATSVQDTWHCEVSPTNECYPAQYKQAWSTSAYADASNGVYAVGGDLCTANPSLNELQCGSANYLSWNTANGWTGGNG